MNLKYLGLKALTYVIQQDPNLALQHQMTIIECLDHTDPIIKRETLELLYRITNEQNVIIIVQKMLDYLKQSKDECTIIALVGKIADLSERYAPNNQWFIQTMNIVFSVGGDVMHSDIPNNFLKLLAEGFDDEKEDSQLRLYAVQSYLALLETKNSHYPQRFLQVISWVLGEYSYLVKDLHVESVMTKLYSILKKNLVTDETKTWIVAAMIKLAARCPHCSLVDKLIQEFSTSLDTVTRQQICELKLLRENGSLMQQLFPINSSCEDLMVDASLSFLDGFVGDALGDGAAPYIPHHQRQQEKMSEKALNLQPYGLCFSPALPSVSLTEGHSPSAVSGVSGNSGDIGQNEDARLKLDGVRKLWGKEGYLLKKESESVNPQSVSKSPLGSGSLLYDNDEKCEGTSSDQHVLPISEEEKEKRQLASTLFVGIGSNAVSLMGKVDQTSKRFKRKSKMGANKVFDKEQSYSPRQLLCDGDNYTPPIQLSDAHIVNSALLDSHPCSIGLGDVVEENVSSLFANSDLDIIKHLQTISSQENHEYPVPSLPPDLAQHPHSPVTEYAGSETLSIFLSKVWKEDSVLLALFIVNKTSSVVNNICVKFEDSENCTVSLSLHCQISQVQALGVQQCCDRVQMMLPCTTAVVSGCVSFTSELEGAFQLAFSVEFLLLDFIRPLVISTEEFGKMWQSFSGDKKHEISISSAQESLSSILHNLQPKLNFYIVEVIGKEGIVACKMLPSVPSLLHCLFHDGLLTLWIRSPSLVLEDCFLSHCQNTLDKQ
ncbi:hypothetical protein GDO86_006298 [Hymenochirus boettgeri]|uniref:AP-4 complex subunit epsilon-1 C-terminal domain-containing protein n=1 Tax=Hymenochirus boettgeri TaxID=247094 RepID=A0A8T2JB05_9PIPI|nr:hypothetical protein GDO86_006298 [Hymenochirus boettgeri]